MLDYSPGSCYRILIPTKSGRRIIVSKDVTFGEGTCHQHEAQPKLDVQSSPIPTLLKWTYSEEEFEKDSSDVDDITDKPLLLEAWTTSNEDTLQTFASVEIKKDLDSVTYFSYICMSSRVSSQPDRFKFLLVGSSDSVDANNPLLLGEAMNAPDCGEWWKDIQDKLKILRKMNTWRPAHFPSGKKSVKSRWIFYRKYGISGEVFRFRSHLVAR